MEPNIKLLTDDMQNLLIGILFGLIIAHSIGYFLTVRYWRNKYEKMKATFVKYLNILDMEVQRLQGKRKVKKPRRDYQDIFPD